MSARFLPAPFTPNRTRPLARLIAIALFAFYLLIVGGHHYSIDGMVMFQSAKQLLFSHSFVLVPPVKWGTDIIDVNRFSVGLMLAYLPALALSSPVFYWMPSLQSTPYNPALAYNPELYTNLPYLLCSWVNPLITALTGSLVFALAGRLGLTPPWATVTALVYGVASPAAVYTRYDFSQPLAALSLTMGVWALLAASGGGLRWFGLAGGALGVMFLTRPEFALLIAWIGVWLFMRSLRDGVRTAVLRVSIVALPVIAAASFYLLMNHLRFGHWSQTGYPLQRMAEFRGNVLEGALGLVLSPGRGIVLYYPLTWLAIPGLGRLSAERRPFGVLCSGLIAITVVFYACYSVWWGGWNWGPRFLLPLLPLLTVAAAYWAFRGWSLGSQGRLLSFAALTVLGCVVTLNGVLLDLVRYHSWVFEVRRLPHTAATYFRWEASPLVSGWSLLPKTGTDLLWLNMAQFAGTPGKVAAVIIAAALIGCLVWSGCRVQALLCEEVPGHRAGSKHPSHRRR